MTLRPRLQSKLRDDEKGETLYYIPHTGARFVHLTCVARGRRHPETKQLIGETNYTEWCAETQALEDTQISLLQDLNVRLEKEKQWIDQSRTVKEQLRVSSEEKDAEMREPTDEEWKEMQAVRTRLEEKRKGYEDQLSDLKIMKWICAEWGMRLTLQERPINVHDRMYRDWYTDLAHLAGRSNCRDTEMIITQPEDRVFFHEQTGFYRKRLCGTVGIKYSEENPEIHALTYNTTKKGGRRKSPFWTREEERKVRGEL